MFIKVKISITLLIFETRLVNLKISYVSFYIAFKGYFFSAIIIIFKRLIELFPSVEQ